MFCGAVGRPESSKSTGSVEVEEVLALVAPFVQSVRAEHAKSRMFGEVGIRFKAGVPLVGSDQQKGIGDDTEHQEIRTLVVRIFVPQGALPWRVAVFIAGDPAVDVDHHEGGSIERL